MRSRHQYTDDVVLFLDRGNMIFLFSTSNQRVKTTVVDSKTTLKCRFIHETFSLRPAQSGVWLDEILPELRLMCFKPFQRKISKSQIHFVEVSELSLLSFGSYSYIISNIPRICKGNTV